MDLKAGELYDATNMHKNGHSLQNGHPSQNGYSGYHVHQQSNTQGPEVQIKSYFMILIKNYEIMFGFFIDLSI